MKIDLSNQKHRLVFIICLLVAAAVVFTIIGYFGGKSVFEARETPTPSPTPSPLLTATVSSVSKESMEITKLRQQIADLKKELDDTNNKLSSKKSGMTTIAAYNDFLEYMTQVIDAHDGFTGWTDAEYQIIREKAEATGNQDFVGIVDNAWNNRDGDPTSRIIAVYRGIVSGIKSGLNQ